MAGVPMFDPVPFLELMTRAGPYAVAIVLYLWLRLERKERLDTQTFVRQYLNMDVKAKETQASAIRALRLALYRRGVLPPDQILEGETG